MASESGVQSCPFQSIRCGGVSPPIPSHHTSPASVSATLVKIVFAWIDAMALGLAGARLRWELHCQYCQMRHGGTILFCLNCEAGRRLGFKTGSAAHLQLKRLASHMEESQKLRKQVTQTERKITKHAL